MTIQVMIIRIHENRAKFDMYGSLQWKPINGKTWYYMHMDAILPKEMHDEFTFKWLPDMEVYGVPIKVKANWDRTNKLMEVYEFMGMVDDEDR